MDADEIQNFKLPFIRFDRSSSYFSAETSDSRKNVGVRRLSDPRLFVRRIGTKLPNYSFQTLLNFLNISRNEVSYTTFLNIYQTRNLIFIAHTFHQEPIKSSPCRRTFLGLIFVLSFIVYHMFRAWDYFVDLSRIQNVT